VLQFFPPSLEKWYLLIIEPATISFVFFGLMAIEGSHTPYPVEFCIPFVISMFS
jgi:hypothetical protein